MSDDENPDFNVDIKDIVPRVDITSQITDDLINAFSDKDWKVTREKYFKNRAFINTNSLIGPF